MENSTTLNPRPRGARKIRGPGTPNGQTPVKYGYFRTFDGTRLFYCIEGQGKPLVFCYGLVCSSLHWTYQIDYFKQNYQAIWFDYRGHHNSDVPSDLGTLSIPDFAKDLGVLLDELQVPQAVVLGHSLGVNVALEFAHQRPEKVAGLVVANGSIRNPLETLLHHNLFQGLFRSLEALYRKSPPLVRAFWNMHRGSKLIRKLVGIGGFNTYLTPPEDINTYIELVEAMDPGIFLLLANNYDRFDATTWLNTIQAPTLILAGAKDKVTPLPQQELIHQLMPNSTLDIIQHGSHCPQMDLPEMITARIESFLKELKY